MLLRSSCIYFAIFGWLLGFVLWELVLVVFAVFTCLRFFTANVHPQMYMQPMHAHVILHISCHYHHCICVFM